MRSFLIILFLIGHVAAQSLSQRLMAPVFFEIGIDPNYQSNPLNLSDVEIEKAGSDTVYLGGIKYSSSNVVSFSGKLNYAPKLISGRKTRISAQVNIHAYRDIPERSYQTYSIGLRQSLGKYRYLNLGYWILPEYYLRHFLLENPQTLLSNRESCSFGTDRLWLGLEHRLSKKNKVEYRLTVRNEIYQAPFSHYNLQMLEGDLKFGIEPFKSVKLTAEIQYGLADNLNDYDQNDRSYKYLNLRPSLTARVAGNHQIRLAARYEQRAYNSEHYDDPLHAGRYQDEIRFDFTLLPSLQGPLKVEPYFGYRERRVESSDATIHDLKSFSRYWFGIRFGFKSVIDMYF